MDTASTAPSLTSRLVKLSVPPQTVVAEAEARARVLIAEAQTDAAAIRERAIADGNRAAERMVAERLVATRAALLSDMAATRQHLGDILAEALAKLVAASVGDDALMRAVDAALARLGDTVALTLVVHPETRAEVERHADAFTRRAGVPPRIETDASLPVDRVSIRTAGQRVDIHLADQIRIFRDLVAG